ncbi:putative F-box protein [Senna tora]|uniref:Putative F-box protein n=1 Tax=Senna tora TaxID=362788 RepID=A0A835CHK9_9FABA|nr:putative F-box protein [Senna tora]
MESENLDDLDLISDQFDEWVVSSAGTQTKATMSSRIPHGAISTIKIDNSDKISCLPEALWHHILFLLPLEDAVTTSSVSKEMLKAWTSLTYP